MSLNAAFQIGRTALTAAQVGIQVTGNNISNASSPGYTRQQVMLNPSSSYRLGNINLGRGVDVAEIRRMTDQALQGRLLAGTAADAGAQTDFRLLSNVEATLNELSGSDLTTQLGRFFNAWSELANAPATSAARSLVVQQGKSLAGFVKTMRQSLVDQRNQADTELAQTASRANDLVTQIANLNTAVVSAEQGTAGGAASLRDQRDQLVGQLAQLMDVSTVEQPNGSLDVLVGSTPVVLAGTARGVQFIQEAQNGQTVVRIATRDNSENLIIASGQLGSLLARREDLVNDTLASLDTLSQRLIYEVNKIHSTGSGTQPLTSITASNAVGATDLALAFNDPTNKTFAQLPFRPKSGSFLVTITDTATNSAQTVRINVDLDGLDNANNPGFANDTSLTSLTASISAALGSRGTATITGDGKLKLDAASGYKLSFGEDTSGVLATLGMNSFFTGTGSSDIDVRADLATNPGRLSTAQSVGGQPSDNGAALAIAALRNQPVAELGNNSINAYWDQAVQSVGTRTDSAKTTAGAAAAVKQNLEAQRAAVSGVSIDEEAVNLISYQRLYEASARYINVVNDMTQTLINLAS
jgi:flagellar hook-associated protein 1 FlgK